MSCRYLVIESRLNGWNNTQPVARFSSIRSLAKGKDFEDVLRGDSSLGKCMQDLGIDAVPSPKIKSPGSSPVGTGTFI